jgi:hypothetical protein
MCPQDKYAKTPDGVSIAYTVRDSEPPLVCSPVFRLNANVERVV